MKRFVADAVLICLMISIGVTLNDSQQPKRENINERIAKFEKTVVGKQEIKPQTKKQTYYSIRENNASQLAKQSSEIIVNSITASIETTGELFDSFFHP